MSILYSLTPPPQVTLALLDSANDKDPVVREQVRKSILTLGKLQPNKVLSMCQDYLVKHPKLIVGHRVVILQTIELIVKTKIDDISYAKIKSIISLASDEMTRSKDVVPDWQQAASNILVAVGNKYINDIMEEILSKFQPGILPHFFVVQTLSSLSESNVYGMVPFLNAILGTMLPMLGMAKQDNMKWVFSSVLYLIIIKDTFSSEIYAAYDILYCSWLQSRESKLRLTVAEAVGSMSHLMAHDKLEEQLPKLIPTILSLYKKNTEHYVISKVGLPLMTAAVILILLPLQVCAPVDYSNPLTVKNHNEVLRCFSILANTFPDRLVMFVLQKLENSNERIRMGSLSVLRHLINSSTSIMESKKLLILASIRQPLADHSNKVKKRVVQVISAMAHHGYLELEGGDLLVKFIIQHCALPDTYYVRLSYLQSLLVLRHDPWRGIIGMCVSQVNGSFPFRSRGHGAPSLSLLNVISPNIHPNAETLWEKEIPALLSYLEGKGPQLNDPRGVAMGIGLCASSHLDATLAKLDDFGKSDAFKKASGIFSLLKNDSDVEKMKSTLILCYGYVALRAPEDQILFYLLLFPQALYKDTFNALQELLRNILARDLSPNGLQSVFKHIEEWLSSGQGHERERAMNTTAHILEFYFNNLHVKNMVTFHNLGSLLGRLAPRCTDPNPLVRRAAIDCIYTLLYIQLRYEGFSLDYKDDSVERLITLRESMDNPDHSVLYKTCSELIISKRLPQQQLNTLIFMLIEGLVDSQSNCSRASSVLLNTLLKNRGAGLQDLVSEMLEVLHIRLQMISEEQVKVSVAQSILILATQHLQTVINTLISYPLPFDSWSCEMWIALGADSKLASQIMEMLMEKLNIMVPYVDKKESMMRGGLTKVATSHPLAMTCALKEMMLNGQSQEAVVSLFPQLFSSLLVRLGSSVGVTLPKDINSSGTHRKSPTKLSAAVEALRILLARAQLDHVVKPLDQEGAWDKMKDPQQHITGVTLLARAMAKHAGPRLPAIVECLCPCLNNIYECQRVTITAFFSELLNHHVVTELMMMDVLMNNMMERISDPCCTVRMLAVRGLGNIAVGSPEKVLLQELNSSELLAAMSSGMEEKDDPGKRITLEAMSGLSKVLLYLDKKNVQLLVVYIFMKIKPFLESENDEIRCASIMLLGNLSKFGSGEPVFKDQIHNVLVSLLLHLSDPNLQVVKACKYAMRVCAPVVGSELITTMFQNHLHEDKSLHYGEFINDLTKYIIQDFPGMLNFYHITVIQFFKSSWAEVRAGAAMFIGR
uniref:Maestro heat-like repeat-containing protein family member 1 n=1 Tax=Oncorhynchus tshawytscha TaxID=74940 RepID=A0AAZ3SRU2_ONCTS